MKIRMLAFLITTSSLLAVGCAGTGEQDLCSMAARHLEQCSGITLSQSVAGCDTDKAERLLGIDCASLADDAARGLFFNSSGGFDDLLGSVLGMNDLSSGGFGGQGSFPNPSSGSSFGSPSGSSSGSSFSGSQPLKCGMHESQCYCVYDSFSGPQLAAASNCQQSGQQQPLQCKMLPDGCYCIYDNVSGPKLEPNTSCGLQSGQQQTSQKALLCGWQNNECYCVYDFSGPKKVSGSECGTAPNQEPLQCAMQGNQCFCIIDDYSGPQASPPSKCQSSSGSSGSPGSSGSSSRPLQCKMLKDGCYCIYDLSGMITKAAASECGQLS